MPASSATGCMASVTELETSPMMKSTLSLIDQAAGCRDTLDRRTLAVSRDELDLAAIDATGIVDLLHGELCAAHRERAVAGIRPAHRRDDAKADRCILGPGIDRCRPQPDQAHSDAECPTTKFVRHDPDLHSKALAGCHTIAHRLANGRIPVCDKKTMFVGRTEGNTTAICRHSVYLWRTWMDPSDLKIDWTRRFTQDAAIQATARRFGFHPPGTLERLRLDDVTGHSITSRDALRAQIADAARRGWTTDEEENERDIFCFGAPILDRRGNAVAAASISIPRFRLRPMAEQVYVAPLLEATTNVSRILGYRPNLSGAKAKAAVAG